MPPACDARGGDPTAGDADGLDVAPCGDTDVDARRVRTGSPARTVWNCADMLLQATGTVGGAGSAGASAKRRLAALAVATVRSMAAGRVALPAACVVGRGDNGANTVSIESHGSGSSASTKSLRVNSGSVLAGTGVPYGFAGMATPRRESGDRTTTDDAAAAAVATDAVGVAPVGAVEATGGRPKRSRRAASCASKSDLILRSCTSEACRTRSKHTRTQHTA